MEVQPPSHAVAVNHFLPPGDRPRQDHTYHVAKLQDDVRKGHLTGAEYLALTFPIVVERYEVPQITIIIGINETLEQLKEGLRLRLPHPSVGKLALVYKSGRSTLSWPIIEANITALLRMAKEAGPLACSLEVDAINSMPLA